MDGLKLASYWARLFSVVCYRCERIHEKKKTAVELGMKAEISKSLDSDLLRFNDQVDVRTVDFMNHLTVLKHIHESSCRHQSNCKYKRQFLYTSDSNFQSALHPKLFKFHSAKNKRTILDEIMSPTAPQSSTPVATPLPHSPKLPTTPEKSTPTTIRVFGYSSACPDPA